MNKKLIIYALMSLMGAELFAMEAESFENPHVPYEPTNAERIEAFRSFLEAHQEIIDPTIVLPELSAEQFLKLTPREQAFIRERGEALTIFSKIEEGYEVDQTQIELLYQYIAWAVGRANLGWEHSRLELGGADVITAAALKGKMESLRAQCDRPFKKGHIRRASTASMPQPTTIDLMNKLAPRGKDDTAVAAPTPLRRARKLSYPRKPIVGVDPEQAAAKFKELHIALVAASASAYSASDSGAQDSSSSEE